MNPEAAWELFTAPPAGRPTSAGERVLERARAFELEYSGPRLDAGRVLHGYCWGSGPTVFLAHGWGGSAAQMTFYVDRLVESGYRVVAVDVPAHGRSEGGRTNIYEFVGVLALVVERFGALHGVVGHSLGAAAATIGASRGLAVGRLVLLAATARLSDEVRKFAARVQLTDEVLRDMLELMARTFEGIWEETALVRLAPTLEASALVVHDEHDPEVAFEDSVQLAQTWRGATFFGTAGLGHVALLRDQSVAERVVAFLSAESTD